MEIRKIGKEDAGAVADLYARCMAETDYFKNLYRMRRDLDRPELVEALKTARGPVLSKTAAYGASFGAWDAGKLAGAHVCFWYKVVREHDGALFREIFGTRDGRLFYEEGIHDRVDGLPGAVLYSLGLCVDPEARRDRVAARLVEASVSRLRPDWLAAAVIGSGALGVYRRLGCAEHAVDGDCTLCVARCP